MSPIERVFTVEGSLATPAEPVSLAEAGLKERTDLQEWVLAHPEILGPDVLILTFEFDRWQAFSGDRQADRLDVLGLDSEGRLVVAELKRDKAPDTVEMQAIKYAAMASRFTEDLLVEQYRRFLNREGVDGGLDEDVARERILAHAGELDPEQLRQPRLVLVAGSFPPVVTASVVWLTEMGLDITLQRVQAYRVFDNRIVVTVSQFFPIPDVEEFTVSPQRAEAKALDERRKGSRERSTVVRLVAAKTIDEGTELELKPTNEVAAEVRSQIEEWIAADPKRGRATWHNDPRGPLEWAYDGERYRPTTIVQQIIAEAAGLQRNPRGPRWWRLPDGRDLPTAAGDADGAAFDWTGLHNILSHVPKGRWTTYGDLAQVVGTAAQPLGQHITRCSDCPNAHRVLGSDGRPRDGFKFSNEAETRGQKEVLEDEQVSFSSTGRADESQRLSAAELVSLLSGGELPASSG